MSTLISFVGAPGVGKTTAATALKDRLEQEGKQVGYSQEYARDFIGLYGHPEHSAIQLHIMRQQKAWEESAFYGNDFAVTDTAVWYSYVFPDIYNRPGASEQEIHILNDLGRQVVNWIPSYHYTFYLPVRDDIEDDGLRDPTQSDRIDHHMRGFIELHKHRFAHIDFLPEGLTVPETVDFALSQLITDRLLETAETPLCAI